MGCQAEPPGNGLPTVQMGRVSHVALLRPGRNRCNRNCLVSPSAGFAAATNSPGGTGRSITSGGTAAPCRPKPRCYTRPRPNGNSSGRPLNPPACSNGPPTAGPTKWFSTAPNGNSTSPTTAAPSAPKAITATPLQTTSRHHRNLPVLSRR